jgi:hypothetical protein
MSPERPASASSGIGAIQARRVLLQWDNGAWSVRRAERIGLKVFPASSRLPKGAAISGFWYELVAPDGAVLYRRVMQDPTRQQVSIPLRDGSYTSAALRRPRALLQILVPAEPPDATLQVWGQQLTTDRRVPRAQLLARLPLGATGRPTGGDAQ